MTGGVTAEGMGVPQLCGRKGEKTWSLQLCGVGPVPEQGWARPGGGTNSERLLHFVATGCAAFLDVKGLDDGFSLDR